VDTHGVAAGVMLGNDQGIEENQLAKPARQITKQPAYVVMTYQQICHLQQQLMLPKPSFGFEVSARCLLHETNSSSTPLVASPETCTNNGSS
jgi:hypothetical protein